MPESDPMINEDVERNSSQRPVLTNTKIWIVSLTIVLSVLAVVVPLFVWQIVGKSEHACHEEMNTDSNGNVQNYSTNADEMITSTGNVSSVRPTTGEDFVQFHKVLDEIKLAVCEPKGKIFNTADFLPRDHILHGMQFDPEVIRINKCDETLSYCQGTFQRCVSSGQREKRIPVIVKENENKLLTYPLTVLEDQSCSCASGN